VTEIQGTSIIGGPAFRQQAQCMYSAQRELVFALGCAALSCLTTAINSCIFNTLCTKGAKLEEHTVQPQQCVALSSGC